MKIRIVTTALCILSALLLSGCSKDESKSLTGSYTYTVSGTLTLKATSLTGIDEQEIASIKEKLGIDFTVQPVTMGLCPEQGQMHIVNDGNGTNTVTVTFNELFGDSSVASGTTDGSSISLTGKAPKSVKVTDGMIPVGSGLVTFSGTGRKDESTLILDLAYEGDIRIGAVHFDVISSEVHCTSQANK
ncbi:MAG: hypothetical protein KBT00_05555 [Bacteroidales bacterium]|nr:hypothetical protein [Candidatus Cacconaster merdequi]